MQLLDAPEAEKIFPADVRARAKEYLDALSPGGTGAYTHSQGVELCRQHVAKVSSFNQAAAGLRTSQLNPIPSKSTSAACYLMLDLCLQLVLWPAACLAYFQACA